MWNHISTAPADRDLKLAVIDSTGEHSLVFPCRFENGQWVNPVTGKAVSVRPTHWQDWLEAEAEDRMRDAPAFKRRLRHG